MNIFVRALSIEPLLDLENDLFTADTKELLKCQKTDFQCIFGEEAPLCNENVGKITLLEELRSTATEITPECAKTTNFSPCSLPFISKNGENIDFVVESFSNSYKNYVSSAKNPKVKAEKLGTSLLIYDFFREKYDRFPPDLCKGKNGKPFFTDFPLEISVSHTDALVLCAFTEKKDEAHSLGIDAEAVPNTESYQSLVRIAKKYFEAEPLAAELFADISESEFCDLFTLLWTKKESLVKMTGEGLGGMRSALLPDAFQKSYAIYSDSKKYYISVSMIFN